MMALALEQCFPELKLITEQRCYSMNMLTNILLTNIFMDLKRKLHVFYNAVGNKTLTY